MASVGKGAERGGSGGDCACACVRALLSARDLEQARHALVQGLLSARDLQHTHTHTHTLRARALLSARDLEPHVGNPQS